MLLVNGLNSLALAGIVSIHSMGTPALGSPPIDVDAKPASSPQPGGVQIKLMLAPSLPVKQDAKTQSVVVQKAIHGQEGAAPIPTDYAAQRDAIRLSSGDELELAGPGASAKKIKASTSVSLPLENVQKDDLPANRKPAPSSVVASPLALDAPESSEAEQSSVVAEEASKEPARIENLGTDSVSRINSRPRTAYGGAAPAPLPPGAKLLGSSNEDAPAKSNAQTIEPKLELSEPKADLDLPTAAKPLQLAEDSVEGKHSTDDAECPGSPESKVAGSGPQPDDIPLTETERPYDAPKAERTVKPKQIEAPVEQSITDEAFAAKKFTARELRIEQGINRTLQYFIANPENVVRRGPWALMHATLPFGVETEVLAGRKSANAIGWMCFNGVCAKQRMFQPTRTGFRPNLGPGMQGHEGQFLAILAQSQVGIDYPIQIGRQRYSIQDLVRYEMATCREKSELTFKLIGLSHYLPGDQVWRDNRRRSWNLEKIVAEELAQPVIGAACGGTHRLMGLSFALVQRQQDGLPMTGHWVRAEKYVNDYINYALSLQNPDGSFSTEWFKGRGMDRDVERKVQTTGHILEWLIYSLPDEHLRSEPIQRGVEFLVNSVGRNPSYDWPIGPRGHALRALVLYNQRVFGAEVGKMEQHVASKLNVHSIR